MTARAIAPIALCALAAGCASGSPQAATPSRTRAAQALAFSECMRAHGVSDFPDPGAKMSGPFNSIAGIAFPSSINEQTPAFQSAQSSCAPLLRSIFSAQGKPPITAALKASLIAQAQCMRTHGVPTYPDPTFPPGGGIAVADAGVNPQSAAYQRAAGVCRAR